MAHKYSNSYVVVDVETGGFDPDQNPLTEVAMVVLDANMNTILEYDDLIKPYDENLEYTDGATKVSGITRSMCEKEGITLKQAVKNMCIVAKEAKLGKRGRANSPIIVAHNANMENKFLTDAFGRCGVEIGKHYQVVHDWKGNQSFHYIDTIDLCKSMWGHIEGSISGFSLPVCLQKIGVEQIDAHRALPDTRYTATLFAYYMDKLRSGGAEVKARVQKENTFRETFQF